MWISDTFLHLRSEKSRRCLSVVYLLQVIYRVTRGTVPVRMRKSPISGAAFFPPSQIIIQVFYQTYPVLRKFLFILSLLRNFICWKATLKMRRTKTTNLTTFVRPTATMTLSSPPGSSPITTITLPPRSTWTSGLHWHETHMEFLRVISGHAWVSISGISQIVSTADGQLVVPKFARRVATSSKGRWRHIWGIMAWGRACSGRMDWSFWWAEGVVFSELEFSYSWHDQAP